MREECKLAVAQAIGRSINLTEAKAIEQRVTDAMKQVARKDPAAWQAMSQADRLNAAAELAGQQIVAEAGKSKQRIALTILAHDRLMNEYTGLVKDGKKPFPAISRILDRVYQDTKGVSQEYFSSLMDTIQSVEPRFLGMFEDARQAGALVKEIFGEDSGSPIAKKAAKAWLDTVESMRQRYNRAGGDVGRLDYGYIPQPHDAIRVLSAGPDKWVADTLPLLDRNRYLNADGTRMDDTQMTAMLREAYETIATGGANKIEPGKQAGKGMLAKRRDESRSIHFKDAKSYLEYGALYNKGGVFSAMQGHVGRLANDIALLEAMGPNPEVQFKFLTDTATKAGDTGIKAVSNQWDVLTGHTSHPVNVKAAEFWQGFRNVQVFGKLQSALLSSVTDIPTYFITTGFNKLPLLDATTNLIRSFGGDTKEYANRSGLIAESIISDMNRWAEGNIGKGWTGKLANATMKASLLEAWTDAIRRGFSVTMMGALGKITRQEWGKLESGDRARLEAAGITEREYKVWTLAKPDDWRGSQMLTPQALRAIPEATLTANGLTVRQVDRAVTKLLGYIKNESEYASLAQDLRSRGITTMGTQRGTFEGELIRSVMLFKGFPIAMISRHWGRMADQWQSGNKASSVAYAAGLSTGLTIFGALALQLKDMANGKDPRDMTTGKFWGAALSQGGGGGILGDMLYTGLAGNDRSGKPNWMNLLGPVAGTITETLNIASKAATADEPNVGDDIFRLARSNLPFVNLWYAKSALDHAGLHEIQEMLSPGYLSRMESRAQTDWNQGYFWRPGASFDELSAPDFSSAAGK